MKRFTLVIAVLFFLICTKTLMAQNWTDNLPQEKLQQGNLTFYEIQKAFNDYWRPFNVDNGYYTNAQGEKVKATGWKQFKRWEWYWDKRINLETGEFPKTTASEELAKHLKENPETDSPSGTWTSLGPSTSPGGYAGLGRVNCAGFIQGDNNTIYVGSASGGIWKTSNGGTTWTPLGDQNAVLGVSDIVAYRPVGSPDVIYIATGDKDGGSMWSLNGGQYSDNNSVGVLKSTDGGTTWNTTGMSWTASQYRIIYRLLMHPTNNSILYAATSLGLFKTTNGGTTWTELSGILEFRDMEFNPSNPAIIYGSTKNGDIYRSIDNGTTWTQTLSTADLRTELAVSANNAAIVYAVVAASSNGLAGIYKSTDSGATFSMVFSGATTNLLNNGCGTTTPGGQAGYDLCIAADPANANILFVGGVNTWKSANGGTAWTLSSHWAGGCGLQAVHADKHFLGYQNGTSTLFEGNDGGIYKTTNSGTNWTFIGSGLAISQIYRLGVAQTVSNENILGLQDNGTKGFLSGSWSDLFGGDGMDCAIDYTNHNTMYGESQNGALQRSTDHGANWSSITSGLTGDPYWVAPFTIDPSVNTTVYAGYQDVFKSTNQGTTWTKISTWNGANIQTITVAPSNSNYIYAATASSLFLTTNGGTSWTNITGTLPAANSITSVSVKNNDPNTAWVSLGGYSADRVHQTTNGGSTWTSISAGLPLLPVMCVIQNKQNTGQVELYAGTDVGVYVKVGAANWTMFSAGLPNVVVTELEIYYNATPSSRRIRAATYGRGLWQSDLYSAGSLPPVANFVASNTTPFINAQVNFSDLSTNTPTSWSWSFSPATVTYLNGTTATSQNPQVKFTATGSYSVTLTATNASGSDPETKTNYINVTNCTVSSFPWNEGFENGGVIPTCWTQQQVNSSGLNWTFITGDGGSGHPAAAHGGTYNACLRDETGADNKTKLITPALNLTTVCNPQLTFWHTQELWDPDQDILTVFYKTSAGGAWIQLATYTSNYAAWTLETISLPNKTGDYYIAFEGNAKYGWGVCVDDVQVGSGKIAAFPWNEGFENGGAIPDCWSQEQVNSSGLNWIFRSGSLSINPNAAHTGTFNACLYDETPADHKTRLITPAINLTSVTTPQLKFWHTQPFWDPDQDQLKVFYKTSAGGAWTQLASYTSGISAWQQETLNLPGKTGDYYIAFEGNAKYGYGICIDDVQVSDGNIPVNFNAQNVVIAPTSSVCYNAQQTITLAGGGTSFTVQNGGSINLIAGKNIVFYPGSKVLSGGYLHGYIAPTGPWCQVPVVTANTPAVTGINPGDTDMAVEQEFYKIYPNPTTGAFMLELSEGEGNSAGKVEIYGMKGEKILNYQFTGGNKHEFTLEGKPVGIYFVRIIYGDQSGVAKIIKE